jgi:type II secretory ATPase GspE/PulE/Tfp pilus assembly ATPase PilB-like protein
MGRRLGDVLCAQGALTPQNLGRGLDEQRRRGGLLGERLIELRLLSPDDLARALTRQTDLLLTELDAAVSALAAEIAAGGAPSAPGTAPAPLVRLVDTLLAKAVALDASDLHLEPAADACLVRYRVHGLLSTAFRLARALHPPLVSRVKILASLDIAERRLPQDGAVRATHAGHAVDLRISSLPTQYGEKLVIRILDQSRPLLTLAGLGLGADLAAVEGLLTRRKGIILVTGPTGSGKTTTLYAMINAIRDGSTNLITVEDPIEYSMPGVNQVQVHPEIGLTFARTLRAILRQDPDVILIGEIRDGETAEIAFRAAMTGHLVLSTLHTNDAPATVTRLIDLGVPRYLVAAQTTGILAQRLVRALCPACRAQGLPALAPVLQLALPPATCDDPTWWRPVGCGACRGTGYRGRISLFESLIPGRALREEISDGASEDAIRVAAIRGGMASLLSDGLAKARAGLTTLEEVGRVLEPDELTPLLCDACGRVKPAGFPWCPFCGARARGFCGGCRQALSAAWSHCPACGAKRSSQLTGDSSQGENPSFL